VVKNALEGALFLFTDAENLTVLAWRSCSNSWKKPLQVFVKVVEGCLIFNFASDPKMQFSLKIGEKKFRKLISEMQSAPGTPGRVQARRRARPRRSPPYALYPLRARTPRRWCDRWSLRSTGEHSCVPSVESGWARWR
jgi:hypothetical protein